jgi:threonine dehydrogenase-like Zn-dependent dehydrogenase
VQAAQNPEVTMKALCWHGKGDVRIDSVSDPQIEHPGDIIVRVTSTAICGSDLHLLGGFVMTLEKGDVLGHEFMGIVAQVGQDVTRIQVGDRVVIPFTVACGQCFFCKKGLYSCCDVSNTDPKREEARKFMGHVPSAMFGYSHMLGGLRGGQAEYVRVPYGDVGAFKIPPTLSDEQALFLTDILPTGYMAAENAEIEPGDTVAVWGCGPVGQFCIRSAYMLGAARVIAIDRVPERLNMAVEHGRAEAINFDNVDVYDTLMEMTDGRGPDRCIDAVGTEAHAGGSVDAVVDRAKVALMLGTDRPHVLREAIKCCRKAGTVSVPGVYLGLLDKIPFGAAMNKGLTIKSGQTHVHRYLDLLLEKIQADEIDPSFVITHRLSLDDAPEAYKTFRDKQDGCIKVVLKP